MIRLDWRKFRHRRIRTVASITVLCVGGSVLAEGVGFSSAQQTVHTATAAATIPSSGEPTGTGAPPLNPCTLVTASEAQAITGGPIAGLVQAPQGPTCIYKLGGAKRSITLSVEAANFSAVTKSITNGAPFIMGKQHSGVCGQLGAQMVFLSLASGQVLNVTAPCPIAKLIAAKALSRLGG
jgi:hypothetical protein